MATAAAVVLSAVTNKGIRPSHDIHDLPHHKVNVVHLARPHVAVPEQPTRLLSKPGVKAALHVSNPDAASEYLLSHVLVPDLQYQMQQDLLQAVQLFSSTLMLDHVNAKLQVIRQQSCPSWHADTVGIRLLCTYAGPGTWYIANRFVKRRFNLISGDVSISSVDDAHGIQVATGDLLFLKGNAYPGMYGAGAVHKSPQLLEGEERLLLTVDDACC